MDISANIKRLGLGKAIDYAIKDPKKTFQNYWIGLINFLVEDSSVNV